MALEEDLLQRVISLEFNRLLGYYKRRAPKSTSSTPSPLAPSAGPKLLPSASCFGKTDREKTAEQPNAASRVYVSKASATAQ